MPFITTLLHSQLFVTPPYPTYDASEQTVIVTGSNTGLGFEAARHFARLNCAKLILAVRTISKGEKARESILETTKRTSNCIEVWPLDLTKSESVKMFARRLETLDRVDVLMENAGITVPTFALDEGHESTIKFNVICTFLLALLALPKMRDTASKYQTTPHFGIVSYELYQLAPAGEVKSPDVYATLNDKEKSSKAFSSRYPISKLLEVLFVRELVGRTANKPVITIVNPGFCRTDLMRNQSRVKLAVLFLMKKLMARTTEVGSRTLVARACAGPKSHGKFMSDGENQEVVSWILTPEGQGIQKAIFEQTLAELEKMEPGISKNI